MSNFGNSVSRFASESSRILREIRSELNNWNDQKAEGIKQHVEENRSSYQTICNTAEKVESDIEKMTATSDKLRNLASKRIDYEI